MTSPNVKKVSEADISLFLAKNQPKKRRANIKRAKATDSPAELAEEFLREFSVSRLYSALVDKRKEPVTIAWYVKRMIKLLDSSQTRAGEKVMILDKLKELIMIGALQDEGLSSAILARSTGSASGGNQFDPFMGKTLKLKGA